MADDTELMPTWKDLWHQRLRWQRGALDNLRHYGLTPVTRRYWAQQLALGAGTIAFSLYLLLLLLTAATGTGTWGWHPLWAAVGALFVTERVVTVWRSGAKARLLALPLIPELVCDAFIQATFLRSVLDSITRRRTGWHHLGRTTT